jgi:xanthosine utilization system XapX-like protein
MGLLITLTAGLAFWIVGFALGWGRSPVDPFLVTVLLVVIAITVRAVRPFVRHLLGNE